MIISFKSNNINYWKEKTGLKPNTLRKIDEDDERFIILKKGIFTKIRIYNTDNLEYFDRQITDYTEYQGWAIISWRHQE